MMNIDLDAATEKERKRLADARVAKRAAEKQKEKKALVPDTVLDTSSFHRAEQMMKEAQEKERKQKVESEQRMAARADKALAEAPAMVQYAKMTIEEPVKKGFQKELEQKKKKAMEKVERQEARLIEEARRERKSREHEENERARRLAKKEAEVKQFLKSDRRLDELKANMGKKKGKEHGRLKLSEAVVISTPKLPEPPPKQKVPLMVSPLKNAQKVASAPLSKDLPKSFTKIASPKQRKFQFDRLAAELKAQGCPERDVNLCFTIEELRDLQRLRQSEARNEAKRAASRSSSQERATVAQPVSPQH